MTRLAVRSMALLLCAVLAAGEATAAAKAKSEDRRQDLEAWLARLKGSFNIRLELPPETKCGALNSSIPNSTQVCTSTKAVTYASVANCRGIGQGTGLYCTFDGLRHAPTDKAAGQAGGRASLLSNELPSRMLLGIDPVAQKITLMILDPGGAGYSGMASPTGNALTFKGRCDLADAMRADTCTWTLSLRAPADGRRIMMTRSNSRGSASGLNAPHTFELTRQ